LVPAKKHSRSIALTGRRRQPTPQPQLNGERSMRLDVPSDKSSRGVGSNLEVGSKLLVPTLLLLLGRTSSGRNPIPGGLEKIPSSEQQEKRKVIVL
jgi:hypothetical protein